MAFDIHVFHFRCPYCAATPPRVLLRDFLREWGESSPARLTRLLRQLKAALLAHMSIERNSSSKTFRRECERVINKITAIPDIEAAEPEPLIVSDKHSGRFLAVSDCAFCRTPAGSRTRDNYFDVWPKACRVQMGNLLYETGLVLWGVLTRLPSWASGETLRGLNELRLALHRAGTNGSFLECPQCGRLGTSLYGGIDAARTGFCRWCLDMGGGGGITFRINVGSAQLIEVEQRPRDFSGPARNCWDILPPETAARIARG